jgi:hypothetical protein
MRRGAMSRSSRVSFWVVLVGALSGCAAPGRGGPSPFDRGSDALAQAVDVSVQVTNDHWSTMRLWIEWPDGRYFLGDVESGRTTTFRVPAHVARRFSTLRLYADAKGGAESILSDELDLGRGRHVAWRLHRVLSFSRAHVM